MGHIYMHTERHIEADTHTHTGRREHGAWWEMPRADIFRASLPLIINSPGPLG